MNSGNFSVENYLESLASKAPVPGGGGASALVAAAGAALDSMVCNLTSGKKKYAGVEPEIAALCQEADELRRTLISLADEDAAVFEPLSQCYAIPKDDPQREAKMQPALKAAAEVPMNILRACCRGIELSDRLSEIGSVLAVSDAGCAAVFFWAAMYAAALNVRINTKSMTDRCLAEALNKECDDLMNRYWKTAEATYERVYGGLQ